jgi:hypothetical protein
VKKLLLLTTALACAFILGGPTSLPFPGPGVAVFGPPPQCTPSGTGNTASNVGGKNRYIFTTSGNLACSGGRLVRVCLIAGGGSGPSGTNAGGGGGGAGGLLINSSILLPGGTNPIVIGAGGLAAGTAPVQGNPGQNSTAIGLTAVGGGFGAISSNGGNGGSGGGGNPAAANVGGTGTAGQGFAGGAGNNSFGFAGGGGGGGAGQVGGNANGSNPGVGGNGAPCPIDGVTYAGGGGTLRGGTAGAGGTGGGGVNCTAPTANSGSGSGASDPSFCGFTSGVAGAAGKMIMEEL